MTPATPSAGYRRHIPGPHPRPVTKNSTIGFPLPRDDREAIVRVAAARDVAVSDLMRQVVRQFLEEQEGEHA